MAEHLWTKGPPPWEYIELVLCRDVYHCRPSELREENFEDIMEHLACLDIEAKVRNSKMKEARG